MSWLLRCLVFLLVALALLLVALNVWGALTLGQLTPADNPVIDPQANKVVMVFGATGSVGDGLLKAAMQDPTVEQVHVVTRRTSPRIDAGVESGRVTLHMLQDFVDYRSLQPVLSEVNTVLWALGTSSLNVDEALYKVIHVDFPLAFATAWLAQRTAGPMSFHNVTGMGTDPQGNQQWARDKGYTEQTLAAMAEGTGLRSFSYRSAFIRPTSEQSNALIYLLEAVLRPGHLVIPGIDLGGAMLEISARTQELPNGTLIDNKDSIDYARAYRARYN